ncbi:MAG: hypothetical protein AB1486_06655 [Planctomycetota bacterium]
MAEDFYSFEKVLRELKLQEDELKRLVSEGEIRAFRDQGSMKFKKEDIESFRKRATGESKDVIEALEKESTPSSASSPTIEAVEELPDELVFEEEEEEVGMATEAITDDSFLEEASPAEDLELAEPAEEPAKKPSKRAAAVAGGAAPRRARAPALQEKTEGAMWQAACVLTAVVLLLAVIAVMDAAAQQSSALSGWIKDFVSNSFLSGS